MNPNQTPTDETPEQPAPTPAQQPEPTPTLEQPTQPAPSTFQTYSQPDTAPVTPVENAPQTDTVTPTPTTPIPSSPGEASEKDRKRVRFVGIALLVLALLSIGFSAVQELTMGTPTSLGGASSILYILPILQALVAVGLLKYNRFAYIAFNIVAAINILFGAVGIVFGLFTLLAIATLAPALGAVTLLLTIASALLQLLPFALSIYGIIVLHPKRVRQLFH